MNYQGFDNIVDFLQMKLQELPLQPHGIIYREAAEYLADALSAAGVGDVSEYKRLKTELRSKVDYIHELWDVKEDYKHRAEVAELALDLCTKDICKDTSGCCGYSIYDTSKEDALKAEKLKIKWINQAEKELQEERENVR